MKKLILALLMIVAVDCMAAYQITPYSKQSFSEPTPPWLSQRIMRTC